MSGSLATSTWAGYRAILTHGRQKAFDQVVKGVQVGTSYNLEEKNVHSMHSHTCVAWSLCSETKLCTAVASPNLNRISVKGSRSVIQNALVPKLKREDVILSHLNERLQAIYWVSVVRS